MIRFSSFLFLLAFCCFALFIFSALALYFSSSLIQLHVFCFLFYQSYLQDTSDEFLAPIRTFCIPIFAGAIYLKLYLRFTYKYRSFLSLDNRFDHGFVFAESTN